VGNELPAPSTIFDRADEFLHPSRNISPPDEWKHWVCELCKSENSGDTPGEFIVVGGQAEWNAHQQTRLHRTRVRRLKKREAWEEWKIRQAEKAERAERAEGAECVEGAERAELDIQKSN
jgi:hypothetical protein